MDSVFNLIALLPGNYRLAGAWQGGVQVRQRVNYWRWRILKEATDPTAKTANMATKTATKIVKIPGKSPKAGKTAKLSPPGSAIGPPNRLAGGRT
jgi:hypothetical protein